MVVIRVGVGDKRLRISPPLTICGLGSQDPLGLTPYLLSTSKSNVAGDKSVYSRSFPGNIRRRHEAERTKVQA